MALFNFGKKKEEKKPCCCSCGGEAQESVVTANTCCGEAIDGICCIKVLGAGCKSCHDQYENVKTAVANMGLSVEVEYITEDGTSVGQGGDWSKIRLKGRGWGHGVGLCQIGAAVMASRGFTYDQILRHYYPESDIYLYVKV